MRRLVHFIAGVMLLATGSHALVDTNANGVSDLWEKTYNNGELFSGTFDPEADPDGDGWTNAREAAAGTDPFDANPPVGFLRPQTAHTPEVLGPPDGYGVREVLTPEAVTVSWTTLVGKRYTLLFSPDLTEGELDSAGSVCRPRDGGNLRV